MFINVVERFEFNKGYRFISFVILIIMGEIKRYFRDRVLIIRFLRRIYEIFVKIKFVIEIFFIKLKRLLKVEEIV